ncbi:MAG: hypothetical protein IPO92_17465 [Saprospiraceae bacterium]|nr:hypothetical protein [Saprospiraceae bacterium]
MYNSIGIVQIFHGGARSPESVTGKQPWSSTEHDMMIGNKSMPLSEQEYGRYQRSHSGIYRCSSQGTKSWI